MSEQCSEFINQIYTKIYVPYWDVWLLSINIWLSTNWLLPGYEDANSKGGANWFKLSHKQIDNLLHWHMSF